MEDKVELDKTQREQLAQIFESPVWDGDLISKMSRDALVNAGLATRLNGINYITGEGIRIAYTLGIGGIATPKRNATAEALSELYEIYADAQDYHEAVDVLMQAYNEWLD